MPSSPIAQLLKTAESNQQAFESMSIVDVIFGGRLGNGSEVFLMRHRVTAKYAVCSVDTARLVVATQNYHSCQAHAKFVGTLSKNSLTSMLDWTSRETAVSRYTALVGEPSSPDRKVCSIAGSITQRNMAVECSVVG